MRHERAGDSRYLLEPNVKEGKGGMRDLQSLFWIAKYLYKVKTPADLVQAGVFTASEAAKFHNARRFLWTVRYWLHHLSGRAQDQLTFDLQIEIAERMRFHARGGQSAVERFMKRYFYVVKEVGDLTRIFCAALEEQQQVEAQPAAARIASSFMRMLRLGTGAGEFEHGLRLENGRIFLPDEISLEEDPLMLLRVFDLAARTGAPVHPTSLRRIRRNFRLLTPEMRRDPEANRLFLAILTADSQPDRVLRLMSETGVLGRFMPEFQRVIGMMQFNMYHHYTVDEHTIRALGWLARMEAGEEAKDLPLSTRLLSDGVNRTVLYVALLLHDIGKGRKQDHSIIGERIARRVCARLGLSDSDAQSVAWLVRWHLLMSDTAQRRDIADLRTIQDFVRIVQSRERMKLLLLLTVCDIRAVGPDVWNGWKAQLLRQLYYEAETMLTGGLDGARESRAARVEAAQDALREALSDWPEEAVEGFIKRHYPAYWLGLDSAIHVEHAHMLRKAGDNDLALDLHPDSENDFTRLYLSMTDHQGLFARMAGAVAVAGAQVVDAKSFTTSDGSALATFWLQDADGRAYDDPRRLKRLKTTIERTLRGEILPREALAEKARSSLKAQKTPFHVAPQVDFDNQASELYTVIEVQGRDRPGLLADLARALAQANIKIFAAIITTYGEKASDVFYVKDIFGYKLRHRGKEESLRRALLAALEGET